MFNWRYEYEGDYGWETVDSYEPCNLEEAIAAVEGKDYSLISTSIGEVDVFEDGEWLITPEEAKALAISEEQAEAEAEATKEAERAAEVATVGDDLDKANIAFILSVAAKYPAKDSGAQRSAEEIGNATGWRDKHQSWRPTEADVIHVVSGREYHIDMWRGVRTITRTLLKR